MPIAQPASPATATATSMASHTGFGADADRDVVGQVHLEAERDQRARIGADAEERDVAERELAGEAEQQVEAHRRDDEDADHDQHVEEIEVGQPQRHGCERGQHDDGGPAAQLIRSFWANRPVGRNSRMRMIEQEAHGVAVAGRDVADADLLGEREDEAAERRADDVAEAAEDDDRERLGGGEVAHGRGDDEHRPEQRAAGGGEAGAEREGRGVDALDAHAHQRGGVAVLEGRPHRHAELGAVDEKIGRRRSAGSRPRTRTPGSTTPTGCRCTSGSAGNGLAIDWATPVQASCSEFCSTIQAPIITSMVTSMSDERSGRSSATSIAPPSTTPSADREHQRGEEVDAEPHHQRVHHVGAERVELAVGEVDHAHDAEDQREPDPEQRVGPSQHEGVEAMLEELVQWKVPDGVCAPSPASLFFSLSPFRGRGSG